MEEVSTQNKIPECFRRGERDKGMEQIKCAIYARYSTNNQRETSIDVQFRACRAFAESKGWIVLEEYVVSDSGVSGQSLRGRTAFQKLFDIGKSEKSPFNYILVNDTARVARNIRKALEIFEKLKFNNVFVFYVSQNIDSKSSSAGMMLTVNGMVDAQNIENISKTTHGGILDQFNKNFSTGGKRYGYRTIPKCNGNKDRYGQDEVEGYLLEVVPKEAEVVREIFRLYADEENSAKEIADILNSNLRQKGEPKPLRSKAWLGSTIKGILQNETYIGKIYWNRNRSKKHPETGKVISEKRPPDEWQRREDHNLRIISDELWQKIQKRRAKVANTNPRRLAQVKKHYSPYLLTGLAKCNECDGTIGIIYGGKYGVYGCTTNYNKGLCSNNTKIPAFELEEKTVGFLSQALTDASLASRIHSELMPRIHSYVQSLIDKQDSSSQIQELIAKQKTIIKNFIDSIGFGGMSHYLKKALKDAETEMVELKNRLSLSTHDPNLLDKVTRSISEEDIKYYFAKLANDLANPKKRKVALESVLIEIRVDCREPGQHKIRLIEKIEETAKHFLKLLNNRTCLIEDESWTGFVLYQASIWHFHLIRDAASISPEYTGKTYILERGNNGKAKRR